MIDVPKKSRKVAYLIEVDSGSRGERAFERGPFILLPRPVARVAEEGARRRDARQQSEDPPRSDLRARRARAAARGTGSRSGARRQPARPRRSHPLRRRARGRRRPRHHHHRRHRRRDQRSGREGEARGDALRRRHPRPARRARAGRAVPLLPEGDVRPGRVRRARAHRRSASLPLFQEQLASRDAAFRRLAIEGIVRAGDAKAVANIEMATAGESDSSAQLARAFASQRASNRGLDTIVMRVNDDVLYEQAMGYLVELGPGIAAPLSQHLKDPNARVRERIAQVLGLIGGKDAQSRARRHAARSGRQRGARRRARPRAHPHHRIHASARDALAARASACARQAEPDPEPASRRARALSSIRQDISSA